MKPKIIACLALVLSGFVLVCAGSVRADTNAEPRYLDKSLSEWIPLTESVQGDVFIPGDGRSFTAVREIGTNALPWLLQWIRSEKPETARLGIEGFALLGPIAKPAVPELIRLVNDWPSSSIWSNAIPCLAAFRDSIPSAFTFLLSAATNATDPVEFRVQVIQSITEMGYHMNGLGSLSQLGTNARLVTPVFLRCLQDKDWRVAAAAAKGLGDYTIEPMLAVPALTGCLESRTNSPGPAARSGIGEGRDPLHGDSTIREEAARSILEFSEIVGRGGFQYQPALEPSVLAQYREAMRRAVPSLVKSLSDEDHGVVVWAVEALGKAALEPDIAVPALLKCLNYPQPLHDLRPSVRDDAIWALGDFGEAAQAAVPALTKLAHDDPLGYVGGGFAATALKRIVPGTKP